MTELTRTTTWAEIGTDISSEKTVESALARAGLDYDVQMKKIFMDGGIEIPDKLATYSIDKLGREHYKGVVSPSYTICQNRDAFDLINTISGDVEFVRMGETHTGMVYFIAKCAPIEVFGDTITPHIILQNSHNGRYTLKTTIVPLRIACQNQFNLAFKSMPNTISIIHSRQLESKIVAAHNILERVHDYMGTFKEHAESLYSQKLTNDQVKEIINGYFEKAIKEAAEKSGNDFEVSARQQTIIEQNKIRFLRAYNAEDNQNFVGTQYGLLNAATDFYTHKPISETVKSADSRFLTVSFDPKLLQAFMNYSMMRAA